MDPILFLKGVLIGFAMAMPVGPISVMSIRKTLAEGHSRGLIIGLGASTTNLIYGGIAAFGLTFVSDVISSQRFWLSLGGGVLLVFLGLRTFRLKRKDPIIPFGNKGWLGSFISGFLLALANPVAVLVFVGAFTLFGLGPAIMSISACLLVLGLFTGSCLWFLALSYITTFFRKKLDASGFRLVNRIAGIFIMLSGVAAFVSLI